MFINRKSNKQTKYETKFPNENKQKQNLFEHETLNKQTKKDEK